MQSLAGSMHRNGLVQKMFVKEQKAINAVMLVTLTVLDESKRVWTASKSGKSCVSSIICIPFS